MNFKPYGPIEQAMEISNNPELGVGQKRYRPVIFFGVLVISGIITWIVVKQVKRNKKQKKDSSEVN